MKDIKPFHFMSWMGHPLSQSEKELITDPLPLQMLEEAASQNGTYYGCWDVIAWRNERVIFIESKRHKADKIRDTQVRWLEAGLATGLKLDNFLVVQWEFE